MDINLNKSFEDDVDANNSVMDEVVGNESPVVEVDLNKNKNPTVEVAIEADEDPSVLMSAIEEKLEVGSVLESLEQAYILYCEYGRCMGFSVKRGTQDYFHQTSKLNMKLYCCSCEGLPDTKRSNRTVATYKKKVARTNCKARIRICRKLNGPWTVTIFEKVHNHVLLGPGESYLLRSVRLMSHAKKSVLEALHSAGIGVSKAYRFMQKEAGGEDNVGFTRKDAYNHVLRSRRESKIEHCDAQMLLRYFEDCAGKDKGFFSSVQLDDEGRLMNFFYRDSRAALDYEFFGDVLSVDTTFKTNKYKMICMPFVGLNHHRKNIMFGMGFLSNETTDTFEWLLSTFLKSMQNKQPPVIFSDQCQTLMNAIDSVFPRSRHRLCQWHVSQNAPRHFGKLKKNQVFMRTWSYFMNGCQSVEEWESEWAKMIVVYELSNIRWFRTMYSLRKRWASVFTNDIFSAGMHATTRSEATNKVLKDLCCSTSTLHDFVMKHEQIIDDWRKLELVLDAESWAIPGQLVNCNPLLIHAAQVYTADVFSLFQYETLQSTNVDLVELPNDFSADDLEFTVTYSGDCHRVKSRVQIKKSSAFAKCSCCMWETEGYFCKHILNVLLLVNVKTIPEKYLLKRWLKTARLRNTGAVSSGAENMVNGERSAHILHEMVFVNKMMKFTYDMTTEFCKEPFCGFITKRMSSLLDDLREMSSTKTKEVKRRPGVIFIDGCTVRNPPMAKRRKHSIKSKKGSGKLDSTVEEGRKSRKGGKARRASKHDYIPSINDSVGTAATATNGVFEDEFWTL